MYTSSAPAHVDVVSSLSRGVGRNGQTNVNANDGCTHEGMPAADDSRGTSAKVTAGGFAKKDVCDMLQKTLQNGDTEAACYSAVELVRTSARDVDTACEILVDTLCGSELLRPHSVMSGASSVVRKKAVAALVSELSADVAYLHVRATHRGSGGGSGDYQNEELFRKTLCKCVVMCSETCRRFGFVSSNERGPTQQQQHAAVAARRAAFDRPAGDDAAAPIARAFAAAKEGVPSEMLAALCALHAACKRGDAERCADVLRCITEDSAHWTSVLPRATFFECAEVPVKARNDVVWYLWRLCRLMACGERREFVARAFHLYRFGGAKKHARARRLGLLFVAYAVVHGADASASAAGAKERAKEYVARVAAVKALCRSMTASEAAHVVFEDVISCTARGSPGCDDRAERTERAEPRAPTPDLTSPRAKLCASDAGVASPHTHARRRQPTDTTSGGTAADATAAWAAPAATATATVIPSDSEFDCDFEYEREREYVAADPDAGVIPSFGGTTTASSRPSHRRRRQRRQCGDSVEPAGAAAPAAEKYDDLDRAAALHAYKLGCLFVYTPIDYAAAAELEEEVREIREMLSAHADAFAKTIRLQE